jgi:predicted ATP-dependent endonuclease of OLD family
MVKELKILGLRGFGKEQSIHFAVPNSENESSGLSIIVGANNSGKTTITEALKAFIGNDLPTFSEGKRNSQSNSRVLLSLIDEKGSTNFVRTVSQGGSNTERTERLDFYMVPSRRFMSYEFNNSNAKREEYIQFWEGGNGERSVTMSGFESRVQAAFKNKTLFDSLFFEILGYNYEWAIDQRENGRYYIKFLNNGHPHSSEGLGDGVWSVFVIAIALFDSNPGKTIIIDEPELSVHPLIQKNLMRVFERYSKDRQIIICTHSIYFIDWEAFVNGAKLIRVAKANDGNSECFEMNDDSIKGIESCLKDIRNPHVLGLDAKEAFFLNDNILLSEGQDDVVIYQKMFQKMGLTLNGTFFGWGVGGASKMNFFLSLFSSLGYHRVAAIFDGDKPAEFVEAETKYPSYAIFKISKDDVRDKEQKTIAPKTGLAKEDGEIKDESKEEVKKLANDINAFFETGTKPLN